MSHWLVLQCNSPNDLHKPSTLVPPVLPEPVLSSIVRFDYLSLKDRGARGSGWTTSAVLALKRALVTVLVMAGVSITAAIERMPGLCVPTATSPSRSVSLTAPLRGKGELRYFTRITGEPSVTQPGRYLMRLLSAGSWDFSVST